MKDRRGDFTFEVLPSLKTKVEMIGNKIRVSVLPWTVTSPLNYL